MREFDDAIQKILWRVDNKLYWVRIRAEISYRKNLTGSFFGRRT